MGITFSPVSGIAAQYTPPVKTTPVVPAAPTQVSPAEIALQAQEAAVQLTGTAPPPAAQSNTYEQAIQQIAASFKNSYAVSDQEFTIFKDVTGQYITRYISLRDGKVTYEPTAPTLVRPIAISA